MIIAFFSYNWFSNSIIRFLRSVSRSLSDVTGFLLATFPDRFKFWSPNLILKFLEPFLHYLTQVIKFSFNKSCYIIYFMFICCSVCCSFPRWQVICSFIVNYGFCSNIILLCVYLSIRKQYGSIVKWIWFYSFAGWFPVKQHWFNDIRLNCLIYQSFCFVISKTIVFYQIFH